MFITLRFSTWLLSSRATCNSFFHTEHIHGSAFSNHVQNNMIQYLVISGPGSSVGTETGYRLDGLGIES
jgi:hypothetical protein